jgi:hypothetical protein
VSFGIGAVVSIGCPVSIPKNLLPPAAILFLAARRVSTGSVGELLYLRVETAGKLF